MRMLTFHLPSKGNPLEFQNTFGTSENRRYLPLGGRTKRSLDLTCASLALIAFSPLLLMIGVLIRFCDGGPVLYRHPRIGHDGRAFHCLKFRTMIVNGDEVLRRHLEQWAPAREEWRDKQKLRSDPRITAVGAVLRQLSLDELPQLVNVLRGEMSLVGPRPIVSEEVRRYGPRAETYFRARPGLTGAWQVSGRSDVSYEHRVALDCDYVENWSLWRDLVLVAKTIPIVLRAKGTY